MKPVLGLKRHKVKVIKLEQDEDTSRVTCLSVIFDMAAKGEHLSNMLPLQINDVDNVS